jgi:hypothetical protein
MDTKFLEASSEKDSLKRKEYLQDVFFNFTSSASLVLSTVIFEKLTDGKFKSQEFIELMLGMWKLTVTKKIDGELKSYQEDEEMKDLMKTLEITEESEKVEWNKEIEGFYNTWLKALSDSLEPYNELIDELMKVPTQEEAKTE